MHIKHFFPPSFYRWCLTIPWINSYMSCNIFCLSVTYVHTDLVIFWLILQCHREQHWSGHLQPWPCSSPHQRGEQLLLCLPPGGDLPWLRWGRGIPPAASMDAHAGAGKQPWPLQSHPSISSWRNQRAATVPWGCLGHTHSAGQERGLEQLSQARYPRSTFPTLLGQAGPCMRVGYWSDPLPLPSPRPWPQIPTVYWPRGGHSPLVSPACYSYRARLTPFQQCSFRSQPMTPARCQKDRSPRPSILTISVCQIYSGYYLYIWYIWSI